MCTSHENNLFHIDLSKDEATHSPLICNTCYSKIRHFERNAVTERSLQSALSCAAKNSHIWCEFDACISSSQCPLCAHYLSFGKGGRKRKAANTPQTVSIKNDNVINIEETVPLTEHSQTDDSFLSFDDAPETLSPDNSALSNVDCESLAEPILRKCRRKLLLENNPGPSTSGLIDTALSRLKTIHSSMAVTADSSTSPIKVLEQSIESFHIKKDMNTPLTEEEERATSFLVRKILAHSENKDILKLKTRGQPLYFQRINKPRKSSDKAGSPLKRKRSKKILKLRSIVSGETKEASLTQEESDLRRISTDRARNILRISKKWKNKQQIPKAYAIAMKAKLGISRDKFRELTRMLKAQQVYIENETSQREHQKKIIPQDIDVEYNEFLYKNEYKQSLQLRAPAVFIKDLKTYLFQILDQYKFQNLLTWHENSIPNEEIWVKIGGDHGQGSLKATLQVLNIEKPNSKFHTSVFAMAQVPDNVHNLQTLLDRFKLQIEDMQNSNWNDKAIRIFLCGDYHFLADMHGISGSSGLRPCLWCLQTKKELHFPRDHTGTNLPIKRTKESMEKDLAAFLTQGNAKLSEAKHFNNVIRSPILSISLNQTVVPYLHILLGLVKNHQQLLEQQCDSIDKLIGAEKTQEQPQHNMFNENFELYIKDLRKIENLEEKKMLQETKLVFLDETLSVLQFYKRTRQLEKKVEKLEERIDALKKSAKPYMSRCGPVCSNLDSILKTHKIAVQAYHGRSFTGNHSQKYIQPAVSEAICSSVVNKTKELTSKKKIIDVAENVHLKFNQANFLLFKIHKTISHSKPIDKTATEDFQGLIDEYMAFYRENISNKIFPKLHFLEHHCIEWIDRWGFGMGLHGEQGVELVHSSIKKLKNQVQALRRPEDQLKTVMMSYMTQVSPAVHCLLPKASKGKDTK